MDFNKEKFKMILHYIIYKCGFKNTVGRTVLHKLMYFSDFNYFELYKESLTNETYQKLARGPVPIHFESVVSELIDEKKISLKNRKLPCGKIMNRYFSLKEPSIDLSEKELAVIDDVIKDLSRMDGRRIGEYSLRDAPVKLADDEGIIDYEHVFNRNIKYSKRI